MARHHSSSGKTGHIDETPRLGPAEIRESCFSFRLKPGEALVYFGLKPSEAKVHFGKAPVKFRVEVFFGDQVSHCVVHNLDGRLGLRARHTRFLQFPAGDQSVKFYVHFPLPNRINGEWRGFPFSGTRASEVENSRISPKRLVSGGNSWGRPGNRPPAHSPFEALHGYRPRTPVVVTIQEIDGNMTKPPKTPAKERPRRANYQDVLDAPEHTVAEVVDGVLYT